MFNLNRKNTTTIQKTTVKTYSYFSYKILIGVFFGSICAFVPNTIFAYGGLDTKIQTALELLRPQDAIKDLYGTMDGNGEKVDVNIFKNMYTKAYRLASVQEDATEIQTVAALKEEITNTYKCVISDDEASNLFKNRGQTATAKECLPLIHCRDGPNDKEKKKKDLSITEFANCKSFITTKYEQTRKAIYDSATLINTTLGTDTYANGTIEDGGYDILYDIQKLGDILFAENDQTTKTLFFSFPNGSIAGLQAVQFGENTTSNALPNSITLTKGANNKDSTNQNENATDRTDSEGGGNGVAGKEGDRSTKENPALSDGSNSNISNYACMPETTKDDTNNETDDTNNDESGKNDGDKTNDATGRPAGREVDINQRGTDRLVQNDTPIVDNADRDDSTSMAENEEQIKSCIKKCTDGSGSFSDKVFCIAKCSCTTKRTDNGMAGISVCMIPTSQTDVLSKKPIQSIQEIIKEINNVLTALRNSGELIKHNKTTEFLDTSLSKIEFNKIFAFDINISMKPIFPVIPKKKATAKNDTESDRMANGTYSNIDIGKEKNKYAFYRNNGITGSKLGETEEANQEIKALSTIQESQSQALIKTQNAQIIEGIRAFILENIVYWDSLADTIYSIQKTSDQIKQKIIKK